MNQHLHGPVLAHMNHMNLSFITTESLDGPIVRVSVDELARVTNLPVRLTWGPLVPRDLALALLGSAGATAAELHGVNAAFDAELARALGTASAQTAQTAPAPVVQAAPMRAPTPAHGAAIPTPMPVAPTVPAGLTASHVPGLTYDEQRAINEKAKIIATLDKHNGNKSEAAAMGMARRTFYRRLKEYGLMRDDEPVPGDTGEHTAVDVPAPVRKVGRPKQRAV